jgi:hypothetical protein
VIAALCVSPERDRVSLYFRLHPDANINSALVLDFLKNLFAQIKKRPAILIWDRFPAHKAKKVRSFILNSKALHSEHLPAYAPELNPVENLWSYLKMNPLANFALFDVVVLTKTARRLGKSVQNKQSLLRSFVKHSPLFLCLK